MEYQYAQHALPTGVTLAAIASVWNNNAVGRHAFYNWTEERLRELLTANGKPVGTLITAHAAGGDCVGFIHTNHVREDGYPFAGVVENVMVDACHRRKGVGTELLRRGLDLIQSSRSEPAFVDALGAWPFGYAFNTLADGSERSGVFLNEPDVYKLFRKAGFEPVRKSIVMRASLHGVQARAVPPGAGFYVGKRTENTWLDRVFRGRELWDYDMVRQDRRIFSRAIFGLMEGESHQEGKAVFSLFGVNTPRDFQGKGYAGMNLSNMMAYVRNLGGDVMELHVYADNTPALRLYSSLGFAPVAETMMMHKRF